MDRLKLLRMRPFVKAARETEQVVQRAVRESKVLSLAFGFVRVEGEHQRTRVGGFILAFSVESSNGMRVLVLWAPLIPSSYSLCGLSGNYSAS